MAYVYDETNNSFGTVTWTSPVNGGPGGASGPITVTQNGMIATTAGNALELTGGIYTVTVNGLLATRAAATGAFTIGGFSDPAALSKVTVGTTGVINGQQTGILAGHAITLVNKGQIEGGNVGVSIFDNNNVNFSVTNSGIITTHDTWAIYIGSGNGKHSVSNSGTLLGGIAINGLGSNTIKNTGYISGGIHTSLGADTVTNSGTVGNIYLGDGIDKFTNSGLVTGNIQMGLGDDTVTGGKTDENVFEEGGKDTYKLGDGIDTIFAVNVGNGSGDGNIDTIDGGSQAGANPSLGKYGDIYSATPATNELYINLDSKSHQDVLSTKVLDAGKATGVDVGIDLIKNFETVFGGTKSDIIFGNASANRLEGWNGDDAIYGGSGNDLLIGGNGVDSLFGDAGRDILIGGQEFSADSNADVFIYRSLGDSTVAVAGRDVIRGFEDGFDQIDLSRLNFVMPSVIGSTTDFSGSGDAEVRVIATGSGWTVQVESNGDKKLDMAIDVEDLTHSLTLDVNDFMF